MRERERRERRRRDEGARGGESVGEWREEI